jgi:biopolymer transport protein ExbD
MINLAVNAQGDVFYNKDAITLPALETELAKRFGQDPATPVYISGDVNTRFADLVKALDLVKRVGFTKVAFNVKPANAAAAITIRARPHHSSVAAKKAMISSINKRMLR